MLPPLSLSVEDMRTSGYQVIDAIVDRYARIRELSTGRKADPAVIRPQLIAQLRDEPSTFETVFEELRNDVLPFNDLMTRLQRKQYAKPSTRQAQLARELGRLA